MIYLDIEVIQQDPYPWMVRPSDQIRAPSNYKDPEKIAAYVAEKVAEQDAELRDRSSLEPLLGGVIVCVGLAVGDGEPGVLVNATGDEEGERAMIAKLQTSLCTTVREVDRFKLPIVSWHGAYDWAFLAKRAIRHGLHALARRCLALKPWGDRLHIDACEPWTRLDSRSLSRQVDVARYLGIEVHDDVHGGMISALWPTERQRVIDHCRSDVVTLREIVRHEIAAGWLPLDAEEGAAEVVIPPPRGSVADLLQRSHRLQIVTDPGKVVTALAASGITGQGTLAEILDTLPTLPTDQLRAYLVALGGRP